MTRINTKNPDGDWPGRAEGGGGGGEKGRGESGFRGEVCGGVGGCMRFHCVVEMELSGQVVDNGRWSSPRRHCTDATMSARTLGWRMSQRERERGHQLGQWGVRSDATHGGGRERERERERERLRQTEK